MAALNLTPAQVAQVLREYPTRGDSIEQRAAQMLDEYDDLLSAILHSSRMDEVYAKVRSLTEGQKRPGAPPPSEAHTG